MTGINMSLPNDRYYQLGGLEPGNGSVKSGLQRQQYQHY